MNSAAAAPLAYVSGLDQPGRPANDNEELIIDLFAGGGGASEGIAQACGRSPDIAVNHDPEAVALHEANHPTTLHLCEDMRKVDVIALLAQPRFAGRRVGILWASPDCKHHSKAAGGRPKDKNIRGLAWEVLRWAAAIKRATGHLPRLIALENVEEYQEWGPLHRYGKRAGQMQKNRKGETFQLWVGSLRSLGMQRIEWRELIAAEFDVPTTRKRLFLVAMSEIYAADWPKATNAPRAKIKPQGDLFGEPGGLKPFRSAGDDVIDWSLKIPTIFGRKKELKPKTKARIAKGIQRYVIESAKPFIVNVTHTKGGDGSRTVDDALKTLTTAKGGELAVAAPTIMPVTHGGGEDRVYSAEDALRTATAANRGELAIAAAHITKFRNGAVGTDAGDAVHTVTANSFIKRPGGAAPLGVVAGFLKPRYGEREGQAPRALDINGPAPTPVPTGNGGDLVGVYLGRQFGSTVSGRDMADPHPTAMTDGGGGKSQIVAASLSRMAKGSVGGAPVEPMKTGTAHAKDAVVTATLTGGAIVGCGGRAGQSPPTDLNGAVGTVTAKADKCLTTATMAPVIDKYYGSGVAADPADALDTATAKARFGLAAAYMEQANTGVIGHSMEEPVSTLLAAGCHQRLIDIRLSQIEAEDGPRRRQVLEFLWEHFGAPTAEEWTDPLATASGRLRFGLVNVDGVVFQIVDIGMRMLVPRELYRAQGFRDDYVIEIVFKGKPLTKTAQTRMAGNSVCPGLARAVVTAFMPPAMQMRRAA